MSSRARMAPGKTRTRGGARDGQRPDGIITGYVLKLIRGSLGLSQLELAELLQVDPNTVQGWESGRRSLAATSVSSLVGLRYRLRGLGAHPLLIAALDVAMEADYLLSFILSGEADATPLSAHPLAVLVTTQGMNEMLAWPFKGRPPEALQAVGPVPRRGPVAAAPTVSTAEANRFFECLRTTAERSLQGPDNTTAAHALLRRQAYYMVGWDPRPEARGWLSQVQQVERGRIQNLDGWSPSWVAARSLVVAEARQGDPEPLREFIRRALASDACEAANLNYWAYWVGEGVGTQHADTFMAGDLGRWEGARLLRWLHDTLQPTTPWIDLNVHSLWALLVRRAQLLERDQALAASLRDRAQVLLDDQRISTDEDPGMALTAA